MRVLQASFEALFSSGALENACTITTPKLPRPVFKIQVLSLHSHLHSVSFYLREHLNADSEVAAFQFGLAVKFRTIFELCGICLGPCSFSLLNMIRGFGVVRLGSQFGSRRFHRCHYVSRCQYNSANSYSATKYQN